MLQNSSVNYLHRTITFTGGEMKALYNPLNSGRFKRPYQN